MLFDFLKKAEAPRVDSSRHVGPQGPASTVAERPVNVPLVCFLEKRGGPPSGLDLSSGLAGPGMQFDFLKEGVVPLVDSSRHVGSQGPASSLAERPVNGPLV